MSWRSRSRLGIGLLACALAMLGRAELSAQPQGELRVALPWTPENLDPTMNLSSIRR